SKGIEQFYKTPADAFAALVATYSVLDLDGVGYLTLNSECASDDCFGGGGTSDNGLKQLDRFQDWLDINGPEWSKDYTGIYRANILLQNIDKVNFAADTATKKRYVAEAHFLRAYFYFNLVRMFGNIPLLDKPVAPGNYNQPQANPDDVYKLIANDLKLAAATLPATAYAAIPPTEYGRVTKWAAEALLDRVFLYYTGYYSKTDLVGVFTKQDAITAINDVITNSGYGLVTNFANLWHAAGANYVGENNKEVVFAVQFTSAGLGDFNQNNGNRMQVLIGIREQALGIYYQGWGGAPVNPKLWNDFAAGDTRKSASIISIADEGLTASYVLGDQYQYTGYFWKKYTPIAAEQTKGTNFQIDNNNDYMAIRFADVLLMGAELNLGTNIATAQTDYNLVRDRAFGDALHEKTLTNDAAGIQLIMDERRFELALEGQRYWDLLRQGLTVAKQNIDNVSANPDFAVSFRLETKGLFTIPETQIGLSNGTLKQNAGW
ncbi:MAG: RagB/SusD family nutrient uptake outer membrane protein, partial [Sphingobacteriales bacterium]